MKLLWLSKTETIDFKLVIFNQNVFPQQNMADFFMRDLDEKKTGKGIKKLRGSERDCLKERVTKRKTLVKFSRKRNVLNKVRRIRSKIEKKKKKKKKKEEYGKEERERERNTHTYT